MTASLTEIKPGVLQLIGEVSAPEAERLRNIGRQLLADSPAETLFLNCQGVLRGGSFCLSLLLCWMRDAKMLEKQLHIQNLAPELQQMARMYGLDSVLPLLD